MATNPLYSPHLQYSPTFRWGGREWNQNDLSAFIKKIGGPKKYEKWARRHRIAAKTFDPDRGCDLLGRCSRSSRGSTPSARSVREYYANIMKNLGGFTTALQNNLAGIAPRIGEAYREGAETMGAAGTGYGAALNNQTAAAAGAANRCWARSTHPRVSTSRAATLVECSPGSPAGSRRRC